MKRLLLMALVALFAISLLVGCGQKAETTDDSAAGQPEEVADTTRLDQAMDTMPMDTAMPAETEGGGE